MPHSGNGYKPCKCIILSKGTCLVNASLRQWACLVNVSLSQRAHAYIDSENSVKWHMHITCECLTHVGGVFLHLVNAPLSDASQYQAIFGDLVMTVGTMTVV